MYQGYSQFKTHRRHMAKIGDWRNSHALEIPLDGVGGVSLLVRAELHRKGGHPNIPPPATSSMKTPLTAQAGIDFPHKPVDHQIETEGLAKLARIAGYSVVGLPNYIVWHFDTAEKEGNLHETPAWLVPLLIFVGIVALLALFRYRRLIIYRVPILRRLDMTRSSKVRQY